MICLYDSNFIDLFTFVLEYIPFFSTLLIFLVLTGNKCDLEDERQVTTQEAAALAKSWAVPFYEASALARYIPIIMIHVIFLAFDVFYLLFYFIYFYYFIIFFCFIFLITLFVPSIYFLCLT